MFYKEASLYNTSLGYSLNGNGIAWCQWHELDARYDHRKAATSSGKNGLSGSDQGCSTGLRSVTFRASCQRLLQ